MADLLCGDCGAPMMLMDSKYGKFYSCTRWPECEGTLGAFSDGKPRGVPGDAETRQLRMRVHALLDEVFGRHTRRTKQADWKAKHTRTGHCCSLNKDELKEVIRKLEAIK